MADTEKPETAAKDPFLTREDLIKRLAGQMMPKGKHFAPSLVMWGDPHGHEIDIDALEHLSGPDDGEQADK
ncbi:MAG: hypothetical protein AAGH57_12045 [Pseudomonadota bacterium]